jgi:hypothetical protein
MHSISKLKPYCFADIGDKECPVIPGAVFISKKYGFRDALSIMTSRRAQPRQPNALKAVTAKACMDCSSPAGKSQGMRYFVSLVKYLFW